MNIENYSNIDKSFEKVKYFIKTHLTKVVTEQYRNKFKEKLASYSDESKSFLYSKLKSSIGLEKYLSELTSFKNRLILTKFRTSDHCLQIETGRYKNIPRQQRLCNICKVVELNPFTGCVYLFETICSIDIGSTSVRESSFYLLK